MNLTITSKNAIIATRGISEAIYKAATRKPNYPEYQEAKAQTFRLRQNVAAKVPVGEPILSEKRERVLVFEVSQDSILIDKKKGAMEELNQEYLLSPQCV